ncbi:MAG: LEA type 2 family protein [Archaeoglobus sp.]|uniref:LEA type 2 family protein n=1 Tax=Archaeoglobus sp. TaxID=1872626 RepID=UPI001D6D02A4|nr:LEA type 2 family protein [Archaeoglobus sp.]MBO8179081.1 LEA type 2 family protein [Archaeoglobus sp.]
MGFSRILVIALLIPILIAGCSQELTIGQPEIRGVSHEWGEVTTSTSEIITKIVVYNPNPIPLPLKDVLTEVYMNNIKMGEGLALKAEIKANSESTILISTKLENDKIPEWWVSHIKNGEKSTMNVRGYLVFDLKVTEFKYPIELSNPIETDILAGLSSNEPQKISIGPAGLTIRSTKSYWGEVNENYTEVITTATIYNDNLVPVKIMKIHYLVDMNGIKFSEGSSNVETTIQPRSEATLTYTIKLDNKMLDEWWVSHIENGEKTKVKIVLQPVIEFASKEYRFTLVEKVSEFITHLVQ